MDLCDRRSQLASNWQMIGDCWYAFEADGTMKTGWVASDEKWYFMGESGVMQESGWISSEGSDYYLKGTGVMATDYVKDGYELDATGKAIPLSQTKSVELTDLMNVNNQTIEGNLYIDATKFKELELSGITVTGKVVIMGEMSESKITIKDSTVNTISSQTRGAEVTLLGTTAVKKIEIEENSTIKPGANYTGKVESVEIQSTAQQEVKIDVPAATVKSNTFAPVSINAPVDNLAVNKKTDLKVNADVTNITVNKTAEDTKVAVEKNVTVGSVTSDTKIEVGGAGKVEDIKGEEISNETEKPSKPSTGGGSDRPTPPVIPPEIPTINVDSKVKFDEVMQSADTSVNIQLTSDIDLGDIKEEKNMLIVPNNKTVIMDLNGYTIKGYVITNGTNFKKLQVLSNDGNLTINDSSLNRTGKIANVNTKSNICTRTIYNVGELIFNGGEISSLSGNALINGGKTTINANSKFTSTGIINGGWDNAHVTIDNRNELIINDGTFKSNMSVIYTEENKSSVQINGGNFQAGLTDKDARIIWDRGGTFSIKSGIFNRQLLIRHIPYGYYLEKTNESDSYTMKKADEITVNVSNGKELIAAITNTTIESKTHKIFVTESITLSNTEALTLDYSDKIIIGEGITLTLNSILNADGEIQGAGTLHITSEGYIGNLNNVSVNMTYEKYNDSRFISDRKATVSKPMDMQWLAYLYMEGIDAVDNIKIEADLDYKNAKADPIGTYDLFFSGTVDGTKSNEGVSASEEGNIEDMVNIGSYTIGNLTIDDQVIAALFGRVENSTFSNITIEGFVKESV